MLRVEWIVLAGTLVCPLNRFPAKKLLTEMLKNG